MSKGSIPRRINIDQYQRYHFIERILNAYAHERRLKVLEVGGALSSALHYLSSNHKIWITDSVAAPDIHLRSSGLNLPFPPKSFDAVVCTDVLEHVPPNQRQRLIEELQRVTGGILILGFPHLSVESKVAEEILSQWIHKKTGADYSFLEEHRSYGLPDAVEVRTILNKNPGKILEACNTNVHTWLPLMMSYFAIEKHEEFEESIKVLNELFNEKYESISHAAPSYRTFFVWFQPVSHHETSFHNVKLELEPRPAASVQDFASSTLMLSVTFQRALQQLQHNSQQRLTAAQNEKTELQAHLKSLDREITLLKDQRRELIKKIENVDQELIQRAQWMQKQDQRIQEKDQRIQQIIKNSEETIGNQRQSIEERDRRIENLQKTIDHQRHGIQDRENQIVNLHQESVHLKEDLHNVNKILSNTQQYLNIFLNHPIYKIYKFFKGERAYSLTETGSQKKQQTSESEKDDDSESLLDKADHLFASADVEAAYQIYHSIFSKHPGNQRAVAGLVRVLQTRGEYPKDQDLLVAALSRDPDSILFLTLLASSYVSTGSFWKAEHIYKNILERSPQNIEACLGLADLALSDAKYRDAMKWYEQVLNVEPENLAALSGLAECAGQHPEAKDFVSQLKKRYPDKRLISDIVMHTEKAERQQMASIIIPVFNQLNYTKQCIDQIRITTSNPYEIIVINNGSADGTMEYLNSLQSDGFKIEHLPENTGFVNACNQGAKMASGEYLVFLNNDTLPEKGWLETLIESVEEIPDAGAVGAKLLYPDGALQEAGSLIFSDSTPWNFGKGDDPDMPQYNYVRETPYCSAACLLIRRDLFQKIGGFDTRYSPAYWEDVDLAFEVRKRGLKVIYQPAARVVHFEGVTGGTNVNSGYKKYQIRNQQIFRKKWSVELKHQPVFDADKLKSASIQNPNPRILAIDHYLPAIDRDSGSHRAYQFMKLIRRADNPLTVIACNGEYHKRYKQELQNLGIETYATDLMNLNSDGYKPNVPPIHWDHLLKQGDYSLAIISRYRNAALYLPLIRKHSPNTKIALDTVDVHFLREQRKADLYASDYLLEVAAQVKEMELKICRDADALITVTEEDACVLRNALNIEKPVWVIPNIHPVEKSPVPFQDRKGLLFIGNFVHPPNSDAMYYFCGQILPMILKELPDLYLYIVGGNSIPLLQNLRSEKIIVTGHVPSTKPFLDHCRLSINPLRYGAGMKGKIGEALARGLPVISTTVGAEGFQFQNGLQALVADDPKDFAHAVIQAYTDNKLWNMLSANGLRLIEERFSPDAVLPAVRSLLNSHTKY
jgi:GT2 family glycosyltransferase/glycosyltransferase involved in cell wall biosynthesis/tetratricopeptide (TPR) repeat protein